MPDIIDPEAVRFCNEWIRPDADQFARAYYAAQALVNEWNARNLSVKIPNTVDAVVDGSSTDGRPPLTGMRVTNIITRAIELVTDYEAGGNAKLNTILAAAVNPRG